MTYPYESLKVKKANFTAGQKLKTTVNKMAYVVHRESQKPAFNLMSQYSHYSCKQHEKYVWANLIQVFLESQHECCSRRGNLILLACQSFRTGVIFCRNLLPSIPTNSQFDSGQAEFICPMGSVNCNVLLKIPVVSMQVYKGPLSGEMPGTIF